MKEIDHVGVVVDDLDGARSFLSSVLGLEQDREMDRPDLGLKTAFFRCGPADIEIIEVTDPAARHRRLGEGTHARIEHIAVRVDDLREAAQVLAQRGVRFQGPSGEHRQANDPLRVGETLNLWTDPNTSRGVQYQLVENASS